jgi:hypothetical protein
MAISKVARAPKLTNTLHWESFWDLHTERINGMSLGPIPISKMHWYADVELGLDDDEKSAFIYIMRRVDSFFVSKQNAKANSKSS